MPVHHDQISIVNTVQISKPLGQPGAVDIGFHFDLLKQVIGIGMGTALSKDGGTDAGAIHDGVPGDPCNIKHSRSVRA